MIKLLVIADDLTGSIDTGAQFAKKGIDTFISFNKEIDISSLDQNYQVLVVDTETRHVTGTEAFDVVRSIVEKAKNAGVKYFYKKTDSTLRGNVGAELDAVLDASGMETLVFIPAFPKMARFTRGGYHYVGEQLLHESGFADDPLEPVTSSFIPDIIEKQTNRGIRNILLNEIRSKGTLLTGNKDILVFDCARENDLKKIAEKLKETELLHLTAGSAGFAEVLAEFLHLHSQIKKRVKLFPPIVFINGSLNTVSLEQIDFAEKSGIESFLIPQEMIQGKDAAFEKNIKKFVDHIARVIKTEKDWILKTVGTKEDLEGIQGTGEQLVSKEDFLQVARRIGYTVYQILFETSCKTFVVFGGDTLMGLMEAMQVSGIQPLDEIKPGIIVSRIAGFNKDFHLITKAGGFGDRDVIVKIIDYIRKKT